MKMQKENNRGNYKKLLKYLKPHLLSVMFVILISIVSVALMIFCALVLRELTNIIDLAAREAMSSSQAMSAVLDFDKVIVLCAILAASYGTSVLCSFFQNFILTKVIQLVSQKLRGEITDKINKVPLKYFDSHQYGDTLSRVTNDVDTISQALNSGVSSLVSSLLQIVGVLIAMFITSWQLALTELATLPISFICIGVFVALSQKFYVGQQKYLGAVNADVEEMYSGQTVIRAFNAGHIYGKKFRENNSNLQKSMFKANSVGGFMFPLMGFVSKIGYIAVCVVGGILYTGGLVDLGALTAFIIFINLFQSPINQLGQLVGTLQGGAAAAGRVFEFLSETEEADESEKITALYPDDVKGDIVFEHIKFGYDADKTILHDFNLTVNSGQKVAIVGPTGAGKTTLVNLLMRFYETNDGSITVNGVPLSDLKRGKVRQLFSMVLQDTWLFEGTIRENLTYAKADVTNEQLDNAANAANIYHFIQTLPNGYDTVLDDSIGLSSGQKQLLTIARAMLEDAPMLILDEATSNVDTRTELLIQEAMDNLSKGKTSFVIAHRLSTIKNADIIVVLKDGDIIESGNHEELLAQNGFYTSLYNSQFSASYSNATG